MKKLLFSATLCIIVSFLSAQKKEAKEGYYYDLLGNKISGELLFKPPVKSPDPTNFQTLDGKVVYYLDGKKKDKLGVKDIQSFVIGEDSITVINAQYTKKRTKKEFAKVLIDGELIVYEIPIIYSGTVTRGGDNTLSFMWGYKKKGEDIAYYYNGLKREKEKLVELLSDHKSLSEEIANMKNAQVLKNFISIAERYNEWHANK